MAAKAGFTAADGHEDRYEVSLSASREKFALWLTPLSSIRGRTTDDAGEPVEGATVLAVQSRIEDGRRRNQMVNAVATNDRGEYRITRLPAGRYPVKASGQFSRSSYYGDHAPPPTAQESFAPVYLGGSREVAGATTVALPAGAEARADFSVTLRPGHRIRGRIINLKPHNNADLQLSSGDEDLGINSSSLELATGRFEIEGVLDGAYRLRVYQRSDGQNPRVSGKVSDGTFEIPSVFPGKYWVSFMTEDGLYISAARAGDTNLLATQELVADNGAAPEMDIVLRADGGACLAIRESRRLPRIPV
jgi:hypothetical protein